MIYQIYPRSWADGNADGIGDLPGIVERLPYLRELGVDAIWVSPFYVSPMADAGYDVADYYGIDPLFGELADADTLISTAHDLGLRVIVDLVPNHTSDEHDWFVEALRAEPGSPERMRYMFRDGKGERGEEPPNNWQSVFGGGAWERVDDAEGNPGQWYLHLFDAKQPDLNWQNPEVREMFHDVLRFWLDRGVDGFRVDVAHGLVKTEGLPDFEPDPDATAFQADESIDNPMWDRDPVHEIYRGWREVLNEYNPDADPEQDRILVAEAWVQPISRAALYTRPDEMHQAFNFAFLECPWSAPALRDVIEDSLTVAHDVGAPTTWVLSNHDVVRHPSRYGLTSGDKRPNGIGMTDPQPNEMLGLRRARAGTTLMLALPGSAYLYQGEELGLPEHTSIPDAERQDPTWERSEHTQRGRDGCRIPMPWEAGATAYGFGDSSRTWLPQPELYGSLAVDRQDGVPGSTLELYRGALRLRREHELGIGSFAWLDGYDDEVIAFTNTGPDGVVIAVITNLGRAPVPLPDDSEVLLTSHSLVDEQLRHDSTVWLRLS
ncbi:MAG TPA: glycoside hydrolase family 13 protein [Ornithinimicrobium sp.]|nr:glycoside hydrolase family 13 protein [Ornithinimicrobium sp.]HKJ12816.1 glycoside hydrolase family 13 protein [Ornithinimicrobium sp.]